MFMFFGYVSGQHYQIFHDWAIAEPNIQAIQGLWLCQKLIPRVKLYTDTNPEKKTEALKKFGVV